MKELVNKISIISNERELKSLINTLGPAALLSPVRVAFVNAHAVNLCYRNEGFLNDLLACDYVLRDGSGMSILYKMLGWDAGLNLNGTDLIPRIIEVYKGEKAALLGTSSPYLENSAAILKKKGLEPVVIIDGFQEDGVYVRRLMEERTSLIILAMGMPKQERIAQLIAQKVNYPCLIICGGAILDFIGGKTKRAPLIFRRSGMEWLYRLFCEPKRLFKRYVIGNLVFLIRSLYFALRFKLKKAK